MPQKFKATFVCMQEFCKYILKLISRLLLIYPLLNFGLEHLLRIGFWYFSIIHSKGWEVMRATFTFVFVVTKQSNSIRSRIMIIDDLIMTIRLHLVQLPIDPLLLVVALKVLNFNWIKLRIPVRCTWFTSACRRYAFIIQCWRIFILKFFDLFIVLLCS